MDTLTINKELHNFIEEADEITLVELYAEKIKGESHPGRYEWWNDEEMVAEMEKMADDIESGKEAGIPME